MTELVKELKEKIHIRETRISQLQHEILILNDEIKAFRNMIEAETSR